MAASGEPLSTGVIPGLARPGGSVTGLSAFTNELIPKRIELLNMAVPGVAQIAFLQNMSNPVASSQWEELNSRVTQIPRSNRQTGASRIDATTRQERRAGE